MKPGCQVTEIPSAFRTTSVILAGLLYLPSKYGGCFITFTDSIQPQRPGLALAHPDKKHLLPDTVSSLRLPLHAELTGTPAGGVICDVSHLWGQKNSPTELCPPRCRLWPRTQQLANANVRRRPAASPYSSCWGRPSPQSQAVWERRRAMGGGAELGTQVMEVAEAPSPPAQSLFLI